MYFENFPLIPYDSVGDGNFKIVTNLLKRVAIRSKVSVNTALYDTYDVKEGESPEIIADKLYGDSELHWIILYANGAKFQHPFYDWPMTQYDFTKFINKKYGSSNVYSAHHYEDANGFEVDSTAAGATAVTNYIYEEKRNDAKRTIRVMQKEFVPLVVNEFKRLMAR